MYWTLVWLKEYMKISWNDQDTYLTNLLITATSLLNKICGVDSFAKWDYTDRIEEQKINWNIIYLRNKPVISIKKINWENYNGVIWTDYDIFRNRKIVFAKSNFTTKFGYITIEYEAWYTTIPYDIELMTYMLASWIDKNKDFDWVSSYKLWDETITFWWKTDTENDRIYTRFKNLLDKYISFNLPY